MEGIRNHFANKQIFFANKHQVFADKQALADNIQVVFAAVQRAVIAVSPPFYTLLSKHFCNGRHSFADRAGTGGTSCAVYS